MRALGAAHMLVTMWATDAAPTAGWAVAGPLARQHAGARRGVGAPAGRHTVSSCVAPPPTAHSAMPQPHPAHNHSRRGGALNDFADECEIVAFLRVHLGVPPFAKDALMIPLREIENQALGHMGQIHRVEGKADAPAEPPSGANLSGSGDPIKLEDADMPPGQLNDDHGPPDQPVGPHDDVAVG